MIKNFRLITKSSGALSINIDDLKMISYAIQKKISTLLFLANLFNWISEIKYF